MGPKGSPSVRGEESPEFSSELGIRSFAPSFIRASIYSTQAFAQTGRGDSDPEARQRRE